MMIPLFPSLGYWLRIDKLERKYLWNGKHPKSRFEVLQRQKGNGGLALPNVYIYHLVLPVTPTHGSISLHQSLGELLRRNSFFPLDYNTCFFLSGITIKKCMLYMVPLSLILNIIFGGLRSEQVVTGRGISIPLCGITMLLLQVIKHLSQKSGLQ